MALEFKGHQDPKEGIKGDHWRSPQSPSEGEIFIKNIAENHLVGLLLGWGNPTLKRQTVMKKRRKFWSEV